MAAMTTVMKGTMVVARMSADQNSVSPKILTFGIVDGDHLEVAVLQRLVVAGSAVVLGWDRLGGRGDGELR